MTETIGFPRDPSRGVPIPDLDALSTDELRAWATALPVVAVRLIQLGTELDGRQWRSLLVSALRGGWRPGPVYRRPAAHAGQAFRKQPLGRLLSHHDEHGQAVYVEAFAVAADLPDDGGLSAWFRPPFTVTAEAARALGQAVQAAGVQYGPALALARVTGNVDVA